MTPTEGDADTARDSVRTRDVDTARDPVKTGLGLAALLLGAVAIRVWAAHQTHVLFNDGPIFLAMAEAIGEGRWDEVLAHPFHPLYPAAIAAVVSVTGVATVTAALAVSICGGAMAVLGATLAARRAFDPTIGWMVGITVALHPWAVDFSSDVMSDGLYAGLYLLGFSMLVRLLARPRLFEAVGCGVFAAAAYLVRPEGVGLAIVAVVMLVGRAVLDRSVARNAIVSALVVTVAALALMAPLLVALSSESGTFTLAGA